MSDYTLFVPTLNIPRFSGYEHTAGPSKRLVIDGHGFRSYGQMINSLIERCEAPVFVYHSDRIVPGRDYVERAVDLVRSGFGLAALYSFAFFALAISAVSRVGWFIEGTVPRMGEDGEYFRRFKPSDVAVYMTKECPGYAAGPSRWPAVRPEVVDRALPRVEMIPLMAWPNSIIKYEYYGAGPAHAS